MVLMVLAVVWAIATFNQGRWYILVLLIPLAGLTYFGIKLGKGVKKAGREFLEDAKNRSN
jgi:uncharacterized protein (DUF58 family)